MSKEKEISETVKRESIEVLELADGQIVKVVASGKLTKASYDFFTPELDSLAERHGKIRLLFEMIDFQGWTLGAAWEDLKFSCKHFNHIERIAIVGDRKWEKAMVTVCRPFTRARLRYFDIDDLDDAADWIQEGL